MDFNRFIGQEKIKGIVRNAVGQDRLCHAYSFEGQSGMGKLTLAGAFSRAILCQNSREGEACGVCQSCRKAESGSHPDFTVILPDKSSIGIDKIRELQDEIIVKPIVSGRKVYIIDEAEKMTVPAQNCLLKTLEDPPAYGVLILCVSNAGALLETIKSRCVRLKFNAYSDQEIRTIISSADKVSSSHAVEFAVAFSQGTAGKAFSAISAEFTAMREEAIAVMGQIKDCNVEELIGLSVFFEENRDNIEDILDIMAAWYRDIILFDLTADENILINKDKKAIILNSIQEVTAERLVNIVELIGKARRNLRMNVNFQMVIDNLLLSLWEVHHDKSCRSAV